MGQKNLILCNNSNDEKAVIWNNFFHLEDGWSLEMGKE